MHLAVYVKWRVNSTLEPCITAAEANVAPHCQSQFQVEPSPERLRSESEMATHAFALHHGLVSISHSELINNLVHNGIARMMTGMNELETFRALYVDRVHPNTQGQMLLADLLIDYLARAEVALAARPVQPNFAPSGGVAIPAHPLDAESVMVFRSLCYLPRDSLLGTTAKITNTNSTTSTAPGITARNMTARHATASSATTGGVTVNSAAAGDGAASGASFGSTHAGENATDSARQIVAAAVAATRAGDAAVSATSTGVGALNIAKADGWQYVEIDGDSQKHKPGWVATEPGSVLWIDLPLLLPSAPGRVAHANGEELLGVQARVGDTLHVHLIYLKSYQHMGQATLNCLEACTCKGERTLDGHDGLTKRSGGDMALLMARINKPGRCILQVQVLPKTESGEHKVKIIHVVAGALLNMTEQLAALSNQRMG